MMQSHGPDDNLWDMNVYNAINLTMLDDISVTDQFNHPLCGITVNKITGELWGKTAACQVDGGGNGGNGGNGGSGAGSVPEPTSWALMLGGFGLVGGAMRASRRERALAAR